MSKRAAAVQLTSDNYEEDEKECDEPGKFEEANEDELKQRVIKKAVRRTNVVANGGGGLFASLKPLTTSGTVGFGQRSEVGLTRPPLSSINQCTVNSNKSDGGGSRVPVMDGYLKELEALNVGVNKWISSHVERNPHVDLTPIFRDYEKHLKTIDLKYKPVVCESESSQESESSSQVNHETEEETTATDGDEENSQETEQQLQLTSQESDDQCFRAKLFYKKAEEYIELGVGNLKVLSSSEQTVRLLMRNDTSIGNVLLNVRLTPDMPMMLNKNNIIVVCPPNPPVSKKETSDTLTYLIRVKTGELAEQLYSTIKDNLK